MRTQGSVLVRDVGKIDSLPANAKSAVLALSIFIDHLESIPPMDQEDLFDLLQELRKTTDEEEVASIRRAMVEIVSQVPVTVKRMPLAGVAKSTPEGLKKWSRHVGARIKELRVKAKLTQEELAAKTGLPQSHISRLEHAEHSATNMTLEKIARALGVEIGKIDPCSD